MSSWGQTLAAAALVLGLSGGAQAGSPQSPGEAPPATNTNPAFVAASSLGLPAGVLVAGGVLWLLFSQGKTLQENAEAWGKLSRRLRGAQIQSSSSAAARLPWGAGTLSPTANETAPGTLASGRRFAVALSYAGEDRPRVGPLAEALALTWGRQRILYDQFHQAEFARPNLDVYLPQLYRDQADLIVVMLSPDYPRKVWCGLELRWIRQLILEGDTNRIMLLSLGAPGDLSQLGILAGDGYLNIEELSADAASALVNERLAQQGGAAPATTATPLPWWRRRWLRPAVAATAGLPLAWLLGRVPLARWQLQQGDEAFRAFAQVPSEERLQRAGAAWQRARQFDPGLAAAHARLGFLTDFRNEPEAAEGHWRQAVDREPAGTAAARAYRTGLAHSIARQPARQQEAMEIYQADVLHPRSAIELTMLRWGRPSELAQASDAINHPELLMDLAGTGSRDEPAWGFNVPPAEVVLFFTRGEQRCVLDGVRATTTHLTGGSPANPLAASGCQGVQYEMRDLLCSRLKQAASNPRAPTTARWLGCPPPAPTQPAGAASSTG